MDDRSLTNPYTEPTEPPEHVISAAAGDIDIEIVDESSVKSHPVIAWVVILLLVGLLTTAAHVRQEGEEHSLRLLEFQGKLLVGVGELSKSYGQHVGQDLASEAQSLNVGPVLHRLCYIVLVGELGSPERALQQVADLQQHMEQAKIEPTEVEKRLLDALSALYRDQQRKLWAAPSLDGSQRELLRDELKWFGRLALAPAEIPDKGAREAVVQPARRAAIVMIAAAAVVVLLFFAGLVGATAFLVFGKHLRFRFRSGSPFGGVYAETFAVWFTLFTGSSLAAGLIFGQRHGLKPHLGVFAISLLALAWPVFRGVPWERVRHEIGWTGGRHALTEIGCGIAGYVSTLPFVAVGLLVTLQLMKLAGAAGGLPGSDDFTSGSGPSHPILEWAATADPWGRLVVMLLAAVAAPVIEETMFRGVLYRHLREATARRRVAISVALAAIGNSFLFAAIHPQGIFGIPVLMTLAVSFSLLREWRGSVLASMTAHALNNAALTMLLLQIV